MEEEGPTLGQGMREKRNGGKRLRQGSHLFDPDQLSEFKKNVCDLYDQIKVVMNGKSVERKYGIAFEACES